MDASTQKAVEDILARGRAEMDGIKTVSAYGCGVIMGTASIIPHIVFNTAGLLGDVAKAAANRVARIGFGIGYSYQGGFNKAQLRFHPQTTVAIATVISQAPKDKQEAAAKEICAFIHVNEQAFLARLQQAHTQLAAENVQLKTAIPAMGSN